MICSTYYKAKYSRQLQLKAALYFYQAGNNISLFCMIPHRNTSALLLSRTYVLILEHSNKDVIMIWHTYSSGPVSYDILTPIYTMGRGVKIPWIGGSKYHGFDIPWVGGLKYHG